MQKTSDIIWQDIQHQALFQILDDLKLPETEYAVCLKLQEYTESHFVLEEEYMLTLNYPQREKHIELHNEFRREVTHLLNADSADPDVRKYMAVFLTEWFKRHVFGIDKDLESFLIKNNSL